ncbi:MAG: GMC family oxidoreductase [Cytophagales bacterium]|nr:MAG: GMC family oxidoreductase [Cytophagales bacterium]
MPFINCNNILEFPQSDYDFTIIGAGAMGILLAVKLSKEGHRVCVLESGNFYENDKKQKLNEVVHTNKILETAVWGRKRAVGGTTIAWGGQSLPFSDFDFQARPWLENSGWDINYQDIEKYYDEANEFMKIDNWGYHDNMLSKLGLLKYKYKSEDFDYHVSKWAKQPNFYKLYKNYLDKKVDVYYNAHVLSIFHYEKKAISIKISNDKKQEFELPLVKLILACGGIETVRLLLLSKLSKSKWLGKCFMEHPCIEFGELEPTNKYNIQRIFNTHIFNFRKYSLRLSLSENFQKKEEILNASVSLLFKYNSKLFNPYLEIKSIFKTFKFNKLTSILLNLRFISKTILSLVRHGFLYKPEAKAMLTLMMEQEASENSYISLSNELDEYSLRKALIHWDISTQSKKTLFIVCKAIQDYFKKNNLGIVNIHSKIEGENHINDLLSGVNHHIGGAKLGNHSENSVVDTNLKLWDFDNIFVCSTAVFPTSSHSNPTLTALAFGCRLVNYFKKNI